MKLKKGINSLPETFDINSFKSICDKLAARDKDLHDVISTYGYPPCWQRPEGFETLIYIILEQQVSLASAKAAFMKLCQKLVTVTPASLLLLSEDELRACYFSRQKILYARHLAQAIIAKQLDLATFPLMTDESIRSALMEIKGIGNWTVDVYLMMALHRADLFPLGDIALIRSIRDTKKLGADVSKEEIAGIAAAWKPYRTVAAFILWHAYLSKRKLAPGNHIGLKKKGI